MLKAVATAVAAAVLLSSAAHAEEKGGILGRVMWEAFQCATYAEMSGKKDEQARLFMVGYVAGKKLLEGIENRTITEAEINNSVPIGVLFGLSGPNNDFRLGRIFEGAMQDAYDAVVKKDENGFPLNEFKWALDHELQVLNASNKYLHSNCVLIR